MLRGNLHLHVHATGIGALRYQIIHRFQNTGPILWSHKLRLIPCIARSQYFKWSLFLLLFLCWVVNGVRCIYINFMVNSFDECFWDLILVAFLIPHYVTFFYFCDTCNSLFRIRFVIFGWVDRWDCWGLRKYILPSIIFNNFEHVFSFSGCELILENLRHLLLIICTRFKSWFHYVVKIIIGISLRPPSLRMSPSVFFRSFFLSALGG